MSGEHSAEVITSSSRPTSTRSTPLLGSSALFAAASQAVQSGQPLQTNINHESITSGLQINILLTLMLIVAALGTIGVKVALQININLS